jgi:plastocyanin
MRGRAPPRARVALAAGALLGGLALSVVPSLGATQGVSAGGSSNVFAPYTVTISVGDSVEWTNVGGYHNVRFEDDSFHQPASPSSGWKVSRTFTTAGTFRYYCEAHGAPGGVGMSGVVVVTPAATGPAPPGSPPPGSSGPPASVHRDTVAPRVRLAGSRSQRILRRRALVVPVTVNEPAKVTAAGTIALPGPSRVLRLRKAKRKLFANTRARLILRLPKHGRALLRSALRRRARLSAKVEVVATDASSNTRTARRTIRLRR